MGIREMLVGNFTNQAVGLRSCWGRVGYFDMGERIGWAREQEDGRDALLMLI